MASNPYKAPSVVIRKGTEVPNVSYSVMPEDLKINTAEQFVKHFAGVDIHIANAVKLPDLSLTVESKLLINGNRPIYVEDGKPTPRKFTGYGIGSAAEALRRYPDNPKGFPSKQAIQAAMSNKVAVSGGSRGYLNRLAKALPKVGSIVRAPPTTEETSRAAKGWKIRGNPRPLDLFLGDEGFPAIKINMHANNGLPVGSTMSDDQARPIVFKLAEVMRAELEESIQRYGDYKRGAEYWYQHKLEHQPWLVTLMGRCKDDYYSLEKFMKHELRFYNIVPRPLVLVMQQAVQVVEGNKENIFDDFENHSAQGFTATKGGAAKLVEKLDMQLFLNNVAFVHCGDDSWVIVRLKEGVMCFALDCSNYDLTQHQAATQPIHEAFTTELAKVDKASAGLWYVMMRRRRIIVHKTFVVDLAHGGPSGMPGQSTVNDGLMDVVLQRVEKRFANYKGVPTEARVDEILQEIGRDLHLSIRVEQYGFVPEAKTLVDYLKEIPFLFVGYQFYYNEEKKMVLPYVE